MIFARDGFGFDTEKSRLVWDGIDVDDDPITYKSRYYITPTGRVFWLKKAVRYTDPISRFLMGYDFEQNWRFVRYWSNVNDGAGSLAISSGMKETEAYEAFGITLADA